MGKRIAGKCRNSGKCLVFCAAVVAISGMFPGKAEAGNGKKSSFCVIVPPARYKPLHEPVRYLPGEQPVSGHPVQDKVASFFKGQVKKVGIGRPNCFLIDTEETVLKALAAGETGRTGSVAVASRSAGLFPGAGYFNRTSRDGRAGFAFGAGIGNTPVAPYEKSGKPDAKVGLVFGFSF